MNTIRRASLNKPAEEGKAWPAIAIGMFVAFGGVLYGYVHELNSYIFNTDWTQI